MSVSSLACLAPNISLSFDNYHIAPSSMDNLDDSSIIPTEEEIVYAETLLPNYVITASGILPNNVSNLERLLYTTNNFFYNFASMVSSSAQKKQFRNTATDHKTLKSHAKDQSKKFRDLCEQIVLATQEPGVKVNFGQNDKFITKPEKSLRNKITQDAKINNISLEEAASQISNALRGTITVQTKRAMESIAQSINETTKLYNGKVLWKNFYNNPTEKGYVGLHAKILLPFRDRHGKICQIVTELQVHDESIYDGSEFCIKERMHKLYKEEETAESSSTSQKTPKDTDKNSISMFQYLVGVLTSNKECKAPKKVLEIMDKKLVPDLCRKEPDFCVGSLRIPRNKMPQLSGDVEKSFLARHPHALLEYPAHFILPSQGDIHEKKVKQLMQKGPRGEVSCDKPILVALGNNESAPYVLDGHHRWAACKKLNGVQKIIGFFGEVNNLLREMLSFPGCKTASLEAALDKRF